MRSEFRKRRRALSDAEQREHGAAVCRWLACSKLRLRRSPVAAYVAHDGEVVLNDFIRQCWTHGSRIALPVVRRRDMEFRTLGRNDQLAPNRFGIEEPVSGRRIPTRTLGAVLTPLVAFTDAGDRLGMGGGFYDRHFSRPANNTPRPLLIGIAHESQRADALRSNAWDVPLDAVVTEDGWRVFNPRAANVALY
ncbi:MAG: 5-formyltetrahydrofolate cyclo-ligase [Gammaproteobacteria bacterium]|nr:5-formyltetrahydrofolate cyclo-ligase [Gammaproteobacteria bacterium]